MIVVPTILAGNEMQVLCKKQFLRLSMLFDWINTQDHSRFY